MVVSRGALVVVVAAGEFGAEVEGAPRAGEASRVAVYVFFVPLVSIVIGAVFLDERPTFSLLIGTFLIVTGIYAVNRSSTGKDKPAN